MTDKELKELKDTLWHSADVLRASAHLAANKYGQPILGLIFLRYADILYKQHKEEIEAEYNRLKGGRMEKSIKENSASDASGSEYDIRKKMIEEGIISQMVTLPSNMFSSVTLPATLWFFDKQKPNTDKKNEILFIDARNVFTQIDRAHRKFSDEQIKNLGVITKLYHGDTQALVDLIDEYKVELANAPESSDDKEILTKAYWQSQIDWLTERFPDGVYADVIGLCKVAPMDGEDGIIDQD